MTQPPLSNITLADPRVMQNPYPYFERLRAEDPVHFDEKMRTWVKYRVMEPRFDRTETAMPNLGVTEAEAEEISRYLLGGPGKRTWRQLLMAKLQTRKALLGLGFAAGAGATFLPMLLLLLRRRRLV